MSRVLLVDDDTEFCELLVDYLTPEGFSVDTVHDGEAALQQAGTERYDVIVLDVMLPKLTGFEVLRELRTRSQTPVLMLTARGDDVDRIVGLEMGADDYLPKPCNPRELVARIRAILRRTAPRQNNGNQASLPETLKVGDVELHAARRTVLCRGESVPLTSTEFSVLEVLLREAGQVVSKEQLSERALARKLSRYDRSIDMHVSNLRKKLGSHPDDQTRIETVRGVGYLYTRPDTGENGSATNE